MCANCLVSRCLVIPRTLSGMMAKLKSELKRGVRLWESFPLLPFPREEKRDESGAKTQFRNSLNLDMWDVEVVAVELPPFARPLPLPPLASVEPEGMFMASCTAIWPSRLSTVAISPWGRTGPYADRPATEWTLQAGSGFMSRRGRRERGHIGAGGRLGEYSAGAFAAVAAFHCAWDSVWAEFRCVSSQA